MRTVAFALALAAGTACAASGALTPRRPPSPPPPSTRPPLLSRPAQPGRAEGCVSDADSGKKLAGVTVVATSPALQGTAAELTDDVGCYTIVDLPPGRYELTFYEGPRTVRRKDIQVRPGGTTPVHARMGAPDAETAPWIDVSSTKGDPMLWIPPRGMDPRRNPWRDRLGGR